MFVIKLTNNTLFRIRYFSILNGNAFSCINKIFTISNNTQMKLVEADGIEPTTYSLQSYRSPN